MELNQLQAAFEENIQSCEIVLEEMDIYLSDLDFTTKDKNGNYMEIKTQGLFLVFCAGRQFVNKQKVSIK